MRIRLCFWNKEMISGNISSSCGWNMEMNKSLFRHFEKGICPACGGAIAKKKPNPDGKTYSFVPKGDTSAPNSLQPKPLTASRS